MKFIVLLEGKSFTTDLDHFGRLHFTLYEPN